MNEPSQEALRKEFAYDSDWGRLVRIRRDGDAVTLLQRPADRPDGRVVHGVGGEIWLEHRLVWIWHNGQIPQDRDVRHRGDSHTNTVENLYLAPKAGSARAEEARRLARSMHDRWNPRISHEDAKLLAADLAGIDLGNDEANRIARLLAGHVREQLAGTGHRMDEVIAEGLIALDSAL
jgi:hypothetical protein